MIDPAPRVSSPARAAPTAARRSARHAGAAARRDAAADRWPAPTPRSAIVATDAVLDQGAGRQAGADGARRPRARASTRCTRLTDGDTLFALATGAGRPQRRPDGARRDGRRSATRAAVLRGVRAAVGVPAPAERARPRLGLITTTTDHAQENLTMLDRCSRRAAPHRRGRGRAAGAAARPCRPAPPPAPDPFPPIVFVHGNGDIGRAVDDDDLALREQRLAARAAASRSTCPTRWRATTTAKAQDGRTSTAEHMRSSPAEVEQGAAAHRRDEGRAGRQLARRQRDPQLHRRTAAARHGVARDPRRHAQPRRLGRCRRFRPGNEFNGAGPFLTRAQRAQGRRTATR